jgi:hypothetical protein
VGEGGQGVRGVGRATAVETYPCIVCGDPVEEGRARLAAVSCHDCDGRPDTERTSIQPAPPVAATIASVDGELRRELYRSRRYERSLVVVAVRLSALNGYRAVARQELENRLRALDRAWEVGDYVFVMLPETDREGADQLLARLATETPGLVPHPHVGLAAFPDDALTTDDLLAVAAGSARPVGAAETNGAHANGNGAHEDVPPVENGHGGMLAKLMRGTNGRRDETGDYQKALSS